MSEVGDRRIEGKAIRRPVRLWRITQINTDLRISHRPTQTHPSTIFRTYPEGMDFVFHRAGGAGTDIYPADPPASPERERWRAGFAG